MPSPPSPSLVSPSGPQAGTGKDGHDYNASAARWSAADDEDDDDDELANPPFLLRTESNDDDDDASTSSVASTSMTVTASAAPAASADPPPAPPILRLPEEMISCIFSFLPPAAVGRASCVCSGWREVSLGYDAAIWREALSRALGSRAAAEAARRALAAGSCSPSSSSSLSPPSSSLAEEEAPALLPSWRRAFLATPSPRCDGVYVSRETYIRTGLTEWTVRNPVHVVVYFRYYRFFPPEEEKAVVEEGTTTTAEGTAETATATKTAAAAASTASVPPAKPSLKPPRGRFWYRTTPDPPAKAARSLALGPPPLHSSSSSSSSSEKNTVVEGRYRLGGGAGKRVDASVLRTAWRVRNSAGTEVRAKFKLRSSREKEGAWDRMDVLALASHDLASGLTLPFSTQQQRRDEDGGGGLPSATARRVGGRRQPPPPRAPPPLTHKRGLSTFVFIPWSGVEDSPLNLPLSQMDCWIPG